MSGTLPRREFLRAALAGLAAGLPRAVGPVNAVLPGRRSFTMDLACGAIGVQVPLPAAVVPASWRGRKPMRSRSFAPTRKPTAWSGERPDYRWISGVMARGSRPT